jgi:hypothetical protein
MLNLIDVADPVIRQVQILQGGFPLESLDASDKVVVQVKSLEGLGVGWETLDLLDFIEGQDQSVQIDEFVKEFNFLNAV